MITARFFGYTFTFVYETLRFYMLSQIFSCPSNFYSSVLVSSVFGMTINSNGFLPTFTKTCINYCKKGPSIYPDFTTWYLKVGMILCLKKEKISSFDLGFKKIGSFSKILSILGSNSVTQVRRDQTYSTLESEESDKVKFVNLFYIISLPVKEESKMVHKLTTFPKRIALFVVSGYW